jgi:hypothetical protein
MTAGCAMERIKMMPKLPSLVMVDMRTTRQSIFMWLKMIDEKVVDISKICKEEGFPTCAVSISITFDEAITQIYISNGDGDNLDFEATSDFWDILGVDEDLLVALFRYYFDTRPRRSAYPSKFKELPHLEVYYD